MLSDFANKLVHLNSGFLLSLLASIDNLLDVLLFFFELDLLVEHLQLGQHNSLDVLERLEEACLALLKSLTAQLHVTLQLRYVNAQVALEFIELLLQLDHLLLVLLYLLDIVTLERL